MILLHTRGLVVRKLNAEMIWSLSDGAARVIYAPTRTLSIYTCSHLIPHLSNLVCSMVQPYLAITVRYYANIETV